MTDRIDWSQKAADLGYQGPNSAEIAERDYRTCGCGHLCLSHGSDERGTGMAGCGRCACASFTPLAFPSSAAANAVAAWSEYDDTPSGI